MLASLGRWLCWGALLLGLAAMLRPVTGSNIMGSGESLSCGPAVTAAMRITEPDSPSEPIMWPGSDLGVGRGAWCEVEAREWLVPVGAAALALLVGGGILLAAGRRQRQERGTTGSNA
jgi:hypothetical protein